MRATGSQLKIKVCGNTSAADLALAAEAGADFAGLILDVPDSPRSLPTERAAELAAEAPLPLVAVVVDAPLEHALRVVEALRPVAVQLHGGESADLVGRLGPQIDCEVWKVLHVPPAREGAWNADLLLDGLRLYAEAGCQAVLLDTAAGGKLGGTGLTSDWQRARHVVEAAALPVILAGGLNADNVAAAVTAVRPAGVDAASGLERAPGQKDPRAVKEFVRRARAAAAGIPQP